ncbi:MAG: hypothetical protein NXI12_15535, partial [Alphaproteobacteria bacterium]|nr:hypothetical protein [Alphaproteobacteria bacterium]
MELEAAGKDRIQTFLAKVKAERALAEKFLSGALDRKDDVGLRAALVDVGLRPAEEDPLFRDMALNAEQLRLEQYALRRAARAKAAHKAASEEEWDQLVAAARDEGPLAALGPPGMGKTTILDKVARQVQRDGGRVLFALPTGLQASRTRQRH